MEDKYRNAVPSPLACPASEAHVKADWPTDGTPIIFTIIVLTYNHADFIEAAINSILAQKTSFPFEVIVHDDASSDETSSIINRYEQRFSTIISAVIQSANLFKEKLSWIPHIKPRIRGRYLAICEGDDYWISESKLQEQFDFLESHLCYSMCYSNSYVIEQRKDRNQGFWLFNPPGLTNTVPVSVLLGPWFLPTATVAVRSSVFFAVSLYLQTVDSVDIALSLHGSRFGLVWYFDYPTSVYRLHDGGVSNLHYGDDKGFAMVGIYSSFNRATKYYYDSEVKAAIIRELGIHLEMNTKIRVLESISYQGILKYIVYRTLETVKKRASGWAARIRYLMLPS